LGIGNAIRSASHHELKRHNGDEDDVFGRLSRLLFCVVAIVATRT
jgi:hypothetical protein